MDRKNEGETQARVVDINRRATLDRTSRPIQTAGRCKTRKIDQSLPLFVLGRSFCLSLFFPPVALSTLVWISRTLTTHTHVQRDVRPFFLSFSLIQQLEPRRFSSPSFLSRDGAAGIKNHPLFSTRTNQCKRNERNSCSTGKPTYKTNGLRAILTRRAVTSGEPKQHS